MTTINEIEDRLNAVAFSGRSYAGSSREEVTAAYNAATRFASSHHEARMIRLAVGEPIEVLVNVSQGTATMSEEDER